MKVSTDAHEAKTLSYFVKQIDWRPLRETVEMWRASLRQSRGLEYLSWLHLVFVLTPRLLKVGFSSLSYKAFGNRSTFVVLGKTRFLYTFQDKNTMDIRCP